MKKMILKITAVSALLGLAVTGFAATPKVSGFFAVPVAKGSSHSTMLVFPYTSRIENNTANQISWNVNGAGPLNSIGADDTQLVANQQTPPPAYADVYLYDQYGTYFMDLDVPNRACVEVYGPSPSQVQITYNCLQ